MPRKRPAQLPGDPLLSGIVQASARPTRLGPKFNRNVYLEALLYSRDGSFKIIYRQNLIFINLKSYFPTGLHFSYLSILVPSQKCGVRTWCTRASQALCCGPTGCPGPALLIRRIRSPCCRRAKAPSVTTRGQHPLPGPTPRPPCRAPRQRPLPRLPLCHRGSLPGLALGGGPSELPQPAGSSLGAHLFLHTELSPRWIFRNGPGDPILSIYKVISVWHLLCRPLPGSGPDLRGPYRGCTGLYPRFLLYQEEAEDLMKESAHSHQDSVGRNGPDVRLFAEGQLGVL